MKTETTYMTADLIESLEPAAREAFARWQAAIQDHDETARDAAFADYCRLVGRQDR